MVTRETIAYLRVVHGSYGLAVFLLFLWQARLGWVVRRARHAGGRADAAVVRRHRRLGPILVLLGLGAYVGGATLGYLDHGGELKHPLHLAVGSLLSLSFLALYFASRRIRGLDSPWQTPHFALGVWTLCLYAVQVFLGLGILL